MLRAIRFRPESSGFELEPTAAPIKGNGHHSTRTIFPPARLFEEVLNSYGQAETVFQNLALLANMVSIFVDLFQTLTLYLKAAGKTR